MERIANDLRCPGWKKYIRTMYWPDIRPGKSEGKRICSLFRTRRKSWSKPFKSSTVPVFRGCCSAGGPTCSSRTKGTVERSSNLALRFEKVRFDGEDVYAGGACSFIRLSVMAAREGLTGLEFAGGIPGTVGGAVYMNAGAHGSDVSRILKYADVVLETGERVRWSNEDLKFKYRFSRLHEEKGIVTNAVFALRYGDRKEIAAAMASNKEERKILRTQPLSSACAGSVFRNPQGDHAARLIESAGLKGTGVGGAIVSEKHANFIVNTGQATANDVLALIDKIRETVLKKHGVELQTEVLWMRKR